ncbi:MAG: Ig-like domain-containing protein, partial [Clostridia bacterium]|nr:Ig-like domain-containing protein [Clostridia bacterium]
SVEVSSSADGISVEDSSEDGGEGTQSAYASGISLNYSVKSLEEGESFSLTASVAMSDGGAYSGDISWTSQDDSVAAVTADGYTAEVYAVAEGQTTVAASIDGYSAECSVTVTKTTTSETVTAAGGYEEGLFVTWQAASAVNTEIKYKLSSEDWSQAQTFSDENLIRVTDDGVRMDIIGLQAGEYDVRILKGSVYYMAEGITVSAYDRSGFAHFNYTDGVGAYSDDGSLKDNAAIIYLTDDNKNDVSESCYVYSASTDSYTSIDITSYFPDGAACCSIGYLLNNSQYASKGIGALSRAYSAVAVRIIGKVNAEVEGDGTASEIEGLTPYASKDSLTGGGTSDNGRMACMKNARNITIEGVGEDACVYGCGFSFISGSGDPLTDGYGYGFEVRNLTFENYPEDAIGMEGSNTSCSVERCWIHNNSFYQGYCSDPAESDKAQGDGTCDFKRGQYYTFSWNYMYACHKTNLIGANYTNEQYNISMHHNYYDRVQSRQPLARTANIHYYNNYIYGATDYVISSRSGAYVFAECNYFESCKNVLDLSTGLSSGSDTGFADYKGFQNVYNGCTTSGDSVTPEDVENRSDTITIRDSGNMNKYIYFECDSSLIYGEYYLTDAAKAKEEVILKAGVHKTANSSSGETSSGESYSEDTSSGGSQSVYADVEINISDFGEMKKIEDGFELGDGVSVYGSNLVIDGSNKSYGGISYTYRLKTGKAVTSAAVKIVAKAACSVTVHLTSSSSEDTRQAGIFSSQSISALIGETQTAPLSNIAELTFAISEAGTYYFGSTSGGINIYYISINYS